MPDPNATLTPEYQSNEPYSWLPTADTSYELPQELLDSPVPEKNSMRILGSYDAAGFMRGLAFMGPAFQDPEYGVLTLAEREFIGVIVSGVNYCTTCLLMHGHLLGEYIGNHGRARWIAINYRSVDLSAQERAIADYCVKLTEQPGRMEEADVQKLRDVGISDEKIYYIIELIGMFNLTNRLASGYSMRPDKEFMQGLAPTMAKP